MVDSRRQKGVLGFIALFEIAIQCIVFLAIISAIFFGMLEKPDYALFSCLWIIIPVTLSYLFRHAIRSFALFLISHIVLACGMVVLMGGYDATETVFSVMLAAVLLIFSIHTKNAAIEKGDVRFQPVRDGQTKQNRDEQLRTFNAGEQLPMAFVAIMAAGYIIGMVSGRVILMNIEAVLCIFFIIFQIIYRNIIKMQQVFSIHGGKNEFPAGQFKKVCIFITVAAALLILLGMTLFYNGEYGNIFTLIGSGGMLLVRGIGKLLIFLLGIFGGDPKNVIEETISQTQSTEELTTDYQMPESPLMEALAETFGLLLLIAMAAGIVYMLVMYIQNFNKSQTQGRDYIDYIKPEEKSRRQKKEIKKQKNTVSGEIKSVRRLYKAQILKGVGGKSPAGSDTPSELTKEYITADSDTASKITGVYEKARYSDEKISKEEIEIIKNLS